MSEKEKKPMFKWLEKLKKVKHIELYIAVIFIVILLLIYLSSTSGSEKSKTLINSELSITSYVNNLENDLEDILSNIGGVSNVKVMITLDMNQASVSNSQLNLEAFPPIKGIIVTANGVNNTAAKLKVLRAIEAVVDISSGSIEILSRD